MRWPRPHPVLASTGLALTAFGVAAFWSPPAVARGDGELDDVEESSASDAPADARLVDARIAFREGLALMTAGDFAAARGKFLAVADVRMTAQVAFNLAECEAHLGMLRAALGNYRLASSRASDGSAPKVAEVVQARITDVDARIAHLTLRRGPGAAGAQVTLDGLELGAGELEADLPLDPGSHVVVLERGGTELARRTFRLEEGQSESILLDVTTGTAGGGDEPSGGRPGGGPEDGGEPDASEPGVSVPGMVLTGAGIVSLGAGIVFLVLRQGKVDDLDLVCSEDGSCPPSAESTADDGRLFTGLAEVTVPLGVAGIAVGVILLVTHGSERTATSGPLRLSPGVAGAAADAPVGGMTATWSF